MKTEHKVASVSRPELLIDQIVRNRIFSNSYWKEECHALNGTVLYLFAVAVKHWLTSLTPIIEETLIDRAIKLDCIGGTYGGYNYPSKFLCLLLKMLQIQPSIDVIEAYITNDDYKYIRALGALYLRLTGSPIQIFHMLEPLYNNFSKVRVINLDGSMVLSSSLLL